MKLPTAFDRSAGGILVTCTECPHWFAFRLADDQRGAYLASEGHLQRVHDVDPHDAAAPRRLWEKRHAADA